MKQQRIFARHLLRGDVVLHACFSTLLEHTPDPLRRFIRRLRWIKKWTDNECPIRRATIRPDFTQRLKAARAIWTAQHRSNPRLRESTGRASRAPRSRRRRHLLQEVYPAPDGS